ncbi:tetratricopeptide repeat protein [Streptomyces spororaveus]|uniref:tetratricopeptide repeat protein n=1 Tax=Streptomyces spororaveus TaxID=284039 RepID=UPI00378D3689
MNTGEHSVAGGEQVQYGRNGSGDNPALSELRARLNDGLARSRISKKDLLARSGLGRTTVWEALQAGEPVPSAKTVAALAGALKLPVGELLDMARDAAEDGGGKRLAPGRPIAECEPHALEVHPAGPSTLVPGNERVLPAYVERAHDLALAEAVRGAAAGSSRMVVLVGGSSTGKTRACWEAVQPLAAMGWRLWHPFDPTRAEAALDDLHRVASRTVVWLNEAQHYLGDRETGERIAAALHGLLTTDERGPVLVLGTLWPEYAARYTAMPSPDEQDPHSRVRELLSGRTLTVPDAFDAQALATAAALARDGDRLLTDALTRAGADGRVAQDLAGAPELLHRYERATPAARALLDAAMDARRLGVGLHLAQGFLTDAAADYLTGTDYDQLPEDWSQRAFAELAEPVHGKQAPLRSTAPRPRRRPPTPSPPAQSPHPAGAGPVLRLADYLEQHGRTARRALCPPDSFWHAALTHLTHPDDLSNLTEAAQTRHRLQWARHLQHRAADLGSTGALTRLAVLREKAGDREGAENFARQAADRGRTDAFASLAELREKAGDRESAENFARQAADRGRTDALLHLALSREAAGDRESAENLYRQAADHGSTDALLHLAFVQEAARDREGAENYYRQAADRGRTDVLVRLAALREEAGDRESAENFARQAADHGSTGALLRLAELREEAGDRESAESLYRQAVDHGSTDVLVRLAELREKAGDRESAENLYRQAADHGSTDVLVRLAELREKAGDRESAEDFARQAADHGSTYVLVHLAELREKAGDRESAENLYRQAADHGSTGVLVRLAEIREKAGDRESAENLARQATDRGDTYVLVRLAEIREKAGDRESAENLYRQAADHGNTGVLLRLADLREKAGDRENAENFARQAADHGSTDAFASLAELREKAGDRESAENLARQAADSGRTDAFASLAKLREKAGDRESAENLYRQAADRGTDYSRVLRALATWWPNGLDPDGTPTPPWQ